MNCSPTLTTEEFKAIHNGLFELDMAMSRLEDVIRPDLYQKLLKASGDIRRGLQGAYDQDRAEGQRKYRHYQQVQQELGLRSTWSVYDVENLSEPHPYKQARRICYKDHWGDEPVIKQITGLTWAALYVAADAAIRDSGDEHHAYIEGFRVSKDDPEVLYLYTGS